MTNTEASAPTYRIDWKISSEERDRHDRNYNGAKHVDVCYYCNRGLTQSGVDNGQRVHMKTDGSLFVWKDKAAWLDPNSQGSFPIGSECAKRIPKEYRGR